MDGDVAQFIPQSIALPLTLTIYLFKYCCNCLDWNEQANKDWTYSFYLKTTERDYVLMANSNKEKQVWLDAFSYIIPSTQILQQIIKENEDNYLEGMA